MTLAAGTRLGPYEILAPLGAGGMGEVYRARDTRLNREVAIKVLPERVARDADALGRFEREAKAVAALSHPNILSIFDVGTEGGVSYAVTELLEGQTLGELLESGPLPPRRAGSIARETAEGLAAAHAKGIVHRDLKPENVFVTKAGHVKILDFGLAKDVGPSSADLTSAPTERKLTEPGTVMGTVGYMSPEQVRGEPLDHRTDVFSFGAILYEMLAGRRAFAKPTAAETMTAILNQDPPELPAVSGLGASLELVARRCLEKDRAARFQDTRDIVFALEMASGGIRTSGADSAPAPPPKSWPRVLGGLLALAAVAAGGWLLAKRARPAEPPRFEPVTFRRGFVRGARFAPDGRTVVFAAAWDGAPLRIFAKAPEGPDARPLDLPSANLLAVSRSGELAIALDCQASHNGVCRGTLARVPLTGGAPREVARDVQQADFSEDGTLAIVRDAAEPAKASLEYPPGKALYETTGHVSFPRVSPDGASVAFFDHPIRGDDQGFVAIVDRSGKKRTLTRGFQSLRGLAWSPSGDEIWFSASDAALRALYGVRLSGAQRVVYRAPGKLTLADVSREGRVLLSLEEERNGVMAAGPGETAERDISWLDLSSVIDMSDDGRFVTLREESEVAGPNGTLLLRNLDGSPPVRLGDGVGFFSPDGAQILTWVIGSTGPLRIVPVGPGEATTIPTDGAEARFAEWVGKSVLVVEHRTGGAPRALLFDPATGKKREVSFEGGRGVGYVTADSRRLLMIRNDGSWALYPVDGGAPTAFPWILSGEEPLRFSGDGRWLFVSRNQQIPLSIVRIDVATGARTPWKDLQPVDKAGLSYVRSAVLSADASAYAYQYRRWLSNLFVATGLK
ncbi:MAG TPA: protein kinase [Thermoanaerobaculia bacterium]|nr:protein kinase [Thermoanaerobaculia bacterium]